MEQNAKKQILRSFKESENILLLTHERVDGDGLSSMLALYLALRKLDKKVTAYIQDPLPKVLEFLPDIQKHLSTDLANCDCVITLDCTQAKVEKLKYDIVDDKVNIIITPKEGMFEENNISFSKGKPKYDTIITLDTGDTDQLGGVYTTYKNLFFETTVINIDHHLSNTLFGTVNLVDPKATSTCEIILSVLESLEVQTNMKLLDQDIATYLLTGITVDTNSFQNSNTTPKAFSVAAHLLGLGANQQMIIRNLYKTHSLSKLRLWGKVLSDIREDKETGLVWSAIKKQDIENMTIGHEEVNKVLDDLIVSATGASIAFLLKQEQDNTVHCSIRTLDETDASRLAMFFNGGGHKKAAGFKIKGDTFEKIENFVVKKFRDFKLGLLELPSEKQEESIGKKPQEEDIAVVKEFAKKVKERGKTPDPFDKENVFEIE